METLKTQCCIAGGGPAGMMLGFLLARAGVDVIVLEKHADFLRDFRGDTIHPSTLELMYELGILDEFLKRPHSEMKTVGFQAGAMHLPIVDFSHAPTHCKFLAFMPQWDFLNFIVEQARQLPNFHLQMEAEVTGLIEENGHVAGARAETPLGELEIHADLTVGADGRHSIVREKAGLEVVDLGAPMDVLWMRMSRQPNDGEQSLGNFYAGGILILLNRGEYWQCGFVIAKGKFDEIREQGLTAFQGSIAKFAPSLADRVHELDDWNKIKLLTVKVDRLRQWHRPGLLCIGDCAHAMSPIGGVGINLAIQDAVAASNILAEPLRNGKADEATLAKVQQRRERPTRWTQGLQLFMQKRVVKPVLDSDRPVEPPKILKVFEYFPWLRRIPARVIGIGFLPEHIKTKPAPAKKEASQLVRAI